MQYNQDLNWCVSTQNPDRNPIPGKESPCVLSQRVLVSDQNLGPGPASFVTNDPPNTQI